MSRPPCENCNCARRKPTQTEIYEHNMAVLRREMAEPSIPEQLARGFIRLKESDV